ncbi:hypothetical protein BU16DRAFT_95662 [Lophium mytilinum]|uniref:Uncharacterized protein n=1 Tax=Lophium mytilinum TaxID=390894 RepID=A0A6A6QL58_9PEZI|nr:hypothetical protein BU16DRAFT_95662 [Lophium mytilinum]
MSDPTSSDAKPRFSLVAAPPTPSSTANAPNPPSSQHPTEQPVTAPRNDVQQDAKEVEKAVGLSSRPVAVGSPLANLVLQIPQHARGQTPTEKTKSTVHHQPIDPTNRCATNSSLRHAAGQFVRAPIRQPTIDLNQPPPGPRVGRRTPSLNDPERDDVPQSPIETSEELHSSWILRIVDVPFDRSDPCRILLVHDPAQDIGASLKRVTQHSGGRARIIEYTFDREFIPLKYELPIQQNLVQHFANAYGLESPTLDYMIHGEGLKRHRGTPATDIEAICSQFLQTSESFPLKKIWTRSMLRPGMLDGPLAMSKSYYCCAEVGENRLVVVIVSHSRASSIAYWPAAHSGSASRVAH